MVYVAPRDNKQDCALPHQSKGPDSALYLVFLGAFAGASGSRLRSALDVQPLRLPGRGLAARAPRRWPASRRTRTTGGQGRRVLKLRDGTRADAARTAAARAARPIASTRCASPPRRPSIFSRRIVARSSIHATCRFRRSRRSLMAPFVAIWGLAVQRRDLQRPPWAALNPALAVPGAAAPASRRRGAVAAAPPRTTCGSCSRSARGRSSTTRRSWARSGSRPTSSPCSSESSSSALRSTPATPRPRVALRAGMATRPPLGFMCIFLVLEAVRVPGGQRGAQAPSESRPLGGAAAPVRAAALAIAAVMVVYN